MLALVAIGVLFACLAYAPAAGAQSGADQYLENVPNPSGEKPGDDKKDSGSGGNGDSGDAGSDRSGSGRSNDNGAAETEDELSEPGKKAAEEEERKKAKEKDANVPGADSGVTSGDTASATVPPGDGGDDGGLSGGVVAFIAILLLGPAAFLIYRRFFRSSLQ